MNGNEERKSREEQRREKKKAVAAAAPQSPSADGINVIIHTLEREREEEEKKWHKIFMVYDWTVY